MNVTRGDVFFRRLRDDPVFAPEAVYNTIITITTITINIITIDIITIINIITTIIITTNYLPGGCVQHAPDDVHLHQHRQRVPVCDSGPACV